MGIVVFVWILWLQIVAAQIAEVSSTFEADHVVTAQGLLRRCAAGRARRSVRLEIGLGSFFFFFQFLLATWIADAVRPSTCTVPALLTNYAKCVVTVLTDC